MADFHEFEKPTVSQRAAAMLRHFNVQKPTQHVYQGIGENECARLPDPECHEHYSPSLLRRLFSINIWFFTSIGLLVFLALQHFSFSRTDVLGFYETGFVTELPDAKPSIRLEQRRFTNALRDYPNGSLYPVFEESEPRYVGLPNQEIDANWHELLHGRYVHLREEEISLLEQDLILPKLEEFSEIPGVINSPGVYGGPDVLHSLHCLNAVRKHLDIEYYKSAMDIPVQWRRMHIDHCIDQLRQAVMCHGDLTPVTLKPAWREVPDENGSHPGLLLLGQTEREHTCRNWDDIRDWATKRGDRDGAVLMENIPKQHNE